MIDDLTDEHLAAWLYGFLGAFKPVDNPAIADPGSAKACYDAALAMLRRLGGAELEEKVLDDMLLGSGHLPARLTQAHQGVACGGWHAKAAAHALAPQLTDYDLGLDEEDD